MEYFEYRGPMPAFIKYNGNYIDNWFSNMKRMDKDLIIDGISFPTGEQAYQALKSKDPDVRRTIANMKSPYEAKRYWRGRHPREDWEDIKLNVMEEILKYKFAPGTSWHRKLMATRGIIAEINNWRDEYFGTHLERLRDGTVYIHGQNHLGKILMGIQDDHRPEVRKIFIGGSRSIRELSPSVMARVDNIVNSNFPVYVGDATSGADALVQRYLADKAYPDVLIFCAGACRNNIGRWWQTTVAREKMGERGFDLYKLKDEAMAKAAHFGFMLWDAKSKGTLNNILNLLGENKKSLVFFEPEKSFYNIADANDLSALLNRCGKEDLARFEKQLGLQKRLERLFAARESQKTNSPASSIIGPGFTQKSCNERSSCHER